MLVTSTRQELWGVPASSLFYLPGYSHMAFSGFVTMHAPSDMGHDRQEGPSGHHGTKPLNTGKPRAFEETP